MDVLMIVYNALISDPYIRDTTNKRIKFYQYPSNGDKSGSYMVIDPISPPLPDVHGDDVTIANEYAFQIDVWSKDRLEKDKLMKHTDKVMKSIGFGNFAGGVDQWDQDTKVYRIVKRYISTIYVEELEQLK